MGNARTTHLSFISHPGAAVDQIIDPMGAIHADIALCRQTLRNL